MAPTTTVIDAGKDLPDNHTPTFAKEPKKRAARLSFCVGKLGAVNIGSNKYVIICIV